MAGRRADRDQVHLKAADDAAGPFLTHGIALEEPEQAEALDATNVEAHWCRARALDVREKQVRTQCFVAPLRLATE